MYVYYVQLSIRIAGGGNVAFSHTINFGGCIPPSPMVDAYGFVCLLPISTFTFTPINNMFSRI